MRTKSGDVIFRRTDGISPCYVAVVRDDEEEPEHFEPNR